MTKEFLTQNTSKIIDLYVKEQKSASEIACMFGTLPEYHKILRVLRKNNITIRQWGETRAINKKSLNIDYFRNIDSSEKAYWLGFLYADGSIAFSHEGTPYKITLALKDKQPVVDFKNAINSGHALGEYDVWDNRTKKSYKRYSLQIASKHFSQHIVNIGLRGKGNYDTKFPVIDEMYYWDFIRGLFDGDGSFINGKRVQFLGTESIIKGLQDFFIKNYNFSKTKIHYEHKLKNGFLCILLVNREEDIEVIRENLYKNSTPQTRMSRKYLKFL